MAERDHKRVDPTFRKMALATEPFVSPQIFVHTRNLHLQLYNLFKTT